MNELNELTPFEIIDKFVSLYKLENNGLGKDISNISPKSIYKAYNEYGREMILHCMKETELLKKTYKDMRDN